jgi:hypothetical protein
VCRMGKHVLRVIAPMSNDTEAIPRAHTHYEHSRSRCFLKAQRGSGEERDDALILMHRHRSFGKYHEDVPSIFGHGRQCQCGWPYFLSATS